MKINVTTNTTAKEIAAVCTTTTAAKGYFKELTAAGVDKIRAKEIINRAVILVKAAAEKRAAAALVVRAEIQTARAWYRDGAKVMHSVFVGFVKSAEFKAAHKGQKFNGNELDYIRAYFPIITETARPVKVVKEEINGVIFRRYRFIDTGRAGAFQRIFDGCLNSVKAARIGSFTQKVIPTK